MTENEKKEEPKKTPRRPAPGLLIVYTGNGKGKTTAALGMIFRALGRKLPIAMVQFIKGKWKTGEREYAESLETVEFEVMGRGFTWESEDINLDKKAAQEAWKKGKEFINSGKYKIIVLDELTYTIHHNFIELKDVLETMQNRPEKTHVVITGRDAPQELMDIADLVTEMKMIKHPFDKGIPAQPGVDF